MKRAFSLTLFLILIIAVPAVYGESPLGFPLGLNGGISPDSTSTILRARGAAAIGDDNYRIDFSYCDISIEKLIPIYIKSGLIAVSLYCGSVADKEEQLSRVRMAMEFITENYSCEQVRGRSKEGVEEADLDSGEELASFTSGDFSLILNSINDPARGYTLNFQIYSLPLQSSSGSK